MGCSASQIQNQNFILKRKATIWFIGGGPGSNKGKIIQYLIRDYKFKFISTYDIIKFQKDRNGQDSDYIKQLILEKKDFPSQFVIKLLKKAISSLGFRNFLIDGFPRHIDDIKQFQKTFSLRQIDFKNFIQVQVSDQQMKSTGVQSKKLNQTKKSIIAIQNQVTQIIRTYRKDIKDVLQYFKKKNKLFLANANNSIDEAYRDIRLWLSQLNLKNVIKGQAKVFFVHFDDQNLQIKITNKLIRKYGFFYLKEKKILDEFQKRNQTQINKNDPINKQMPSDFYQSQFRKKIQKKNYNGNFLISGYPRTVLDAQQWDRAFGWQANVNGYLCITNPDNKQKQIYLTKQTIKNQLINSQQEIKKFQNQRKELILLCKNYDKQQKLLKYEVKGQSIHQQICQQIQEFIQIKNLKHKQKISNKKLIFVNTINQPAYILQKIEDKNWKIINMAYLYQAEVKQQNLYSQLINSYILSGKPVPGQIATKCLLKNLQIIHQQNIIVKGFPHSMEQLQSWEEEIGNLYNLPKIIYFAYNSMSVLSLLNEKKITNPQILLKSIEKNYNELESYLNTLQITKIKLKQNSSIQEIKNFIKE